VNFDTLYAQNLQDQKKTDTIDTTITESDGHLH
jgi:hypothetical protein